MFYVATEGEIAVSPSLVALLGEGRHHALNDEALAVLLRVGFLVGDDTPFEHVHLLPPHGVLTWEDGRYSVSGTFVTPAAQSYTRPAAVDAYVERFREAIRRRAESGLTVVPLSGGRDSRHIFLEMCAQGRPPTLAATIALSPAPHTDVDVARLLTRRAGVRHVTLRLPSDRWKAETANTVETHFSTFEHWWLRPLVGYLDGLGATVYEGVAGDVLSTFFLKTPERQRLYADGDLETLAETFLGGEGYLPLVLPPEQYARCSREVARARLVRELARHLDAPHPLASFLVYNRSRRVTSLAPSSLLGRVATVWCPYLDADVFDFLMSLPPDVLAGGEEHTFHDAAIARAYPDYADVPYQTNTGRRRPTAQYDWRLTLSIVRALFQNRPALIRPSFAYPRLARAMVDPVYAPEVKKSTALMSYLLQLSQYATVRRE